MSGIVGLWNLDGRPVEETLLVRLGERLAHRGQDAGLWVDGAAGLACRLSRSTPEAARETQPLVDSSGAVLVFDGRLDNREELVRLLRDSAGIASDCPDPALVLAAYEAFGEDFAGRLNGDFALAVFDRRRRRLLLVRDALGVRPLYYTRAGQTFLFASEIKALLAHPQVSPRPNDDLLAEFLLSGPAQDNPGLTFFEGISSVLPGHMLAVTPDGMSARRYWDFDPARRLRFRSFPDYAEAFRHHFQEAVRRRLRSAHPVAVSVSGGLDSSSIFCVAETLRREKPQRHPALLGLTYSSTDGSPSDETPFLAEIERAYGVTLDRCSTGPVGFLDRCEEAVSYAEAPMLDGMWNNTCAFLAHVRERGARVLLAGHWGDHVLFEQTYLIDLVRRGAWLEAGRHLREFPRWSTDTDPRHFQRTFFNDLVRTHVPEALLPALRRLRISLSRTKADRPWYAREFTGRARRAAARRSENGTRFASFHARTLYHLLRSRYHVLSMEWQNKVAAQHGLEAAFPFLDRDLIGFLLAIPGEMQNWRGVPRAILRHGLRGILPEAVTQRRSKGDYAHLENAGMEQDFSAVVRRLQCGRAVGAGYVQPELLRAELARLPGRFGGPDCEATWRVSDLFALELWLQVFFAETPTERRTDTYAAAD